MSETTADFLLERLHANDDLGEEPAVANPPLVERRLADYVLLAETRGHPERIETVFRRLEVSSTSNLSRSFESAVAQHDELATSIVEPRLADLFHAQAALHTEHWEMSAYRTLLPLLPGDAGDVLNPSYAEEGGAAKRLVATIDRLAGPG